MNKRILYITTSIISVLCSGILLYTLYNSVSSVITHNKEFSKQSNTELDSLAKSNIELTDKILKQQDTILLYLDSLKKYKYDKTSK